MHSAPGQLEVGLLRLAALSGLRSRLHDLVVLHLKAPQVPLWNRGSGVPHMRTGFVRADATAFERIPGRL